MSDIVERNNIATGLRQIAKIKPSFDLDREVMIEAAAEIERLGAEKAGLLAALAFAASVIKGGEPWTTECEARIGAALTGGKE